MSIPAAAQVAPLANFSQAVAITDQGGKLTQNGIQTLQGLIGFLNGTNRIVPCNASGTNVITLTMLKTSPMVTQYCDFDTFRAVAANTTTGLVTALVATPSGNLGTIKVFKTNGSAQATSGDVTSGLLYDFTFVDSLDSGNGGFVLR